MCMRMCNKEAHAQASQHVSAYRISACESTVTPPDRTNMGFLIHEHLKQSTRSKPGNEHGNQSAIKAQCEQKKDFKKKKRIMARLSIKGIIMIEQDSPVHGKRRLNGPRKNSIENPIKTPG